MMQYGFGGKRSGPGKWNMSDDDGEEVVSGCGIFWFGDQNHSSPSSSSSSHQHRRHHKLYLPFQVRWGWVAFFLCVIGLDLDPIYSMSLLFYK